MNDLAIRALNLKEAHIFKLVLTISILLGWVMALGGASAAILQDIYGNWQLARNNSLTVYLPPETETTAVQQLQQSLSSLAGINQVRQVSAAQVQASLKPIVSSPESLPLPILLEVDIAPEADRPQLVEHIRQSFPTAEIDDHKPLLFHVQKAVRSLQAAAGALSVILLSIMCLLIILAVRTGLAGQRPTLHLLSLLGATDACLSRTITNQLSVQVLAGATVGAAAAAGMLGLACLVAPSFTQQITLSTWTSLFCLPLLLPILTAVTANITCRNLLRHLE